MTAAMLATKARHPAALAIRCEGAAFVADFARRAGRQRLVASIAAVTRRQTSGPIEPDGRTVKAERGTRDDSEGSVPPQGREFEGGISLPRIGGPARYSPGSGRRLCRSGLRGSGHRCGRCRAGL